MAERGTLRMSRKERDAQVALERVKRREMSLAEAAEVLGISYRQCRRRYVRYKADGAAGLVHRLRGCESNRKLSEKILELILRLYREIYEGFGPMLFTEKLLDLHKIKVDHETVRRLLIKEGLWRATRKKKKRHRAWRERRVHFGEMVQMDGSHHLWFEDRGEMCCLMVMIDDATGIRMSLLATGETTDAAMRLLWMWIRRYGVPKSLYTDKKNVFVPSEKDADLARLEGREALTQFGRACKKLDIEIIRAHSPEAKGRVERSNGVYQDRLVKELRLLGISDIETANELLDGGGFDQDLNRRFATPARESADYHRAASDYDLPSIFCIEQQRTLSANWTLSFENRVYQIERASANYSPASRKVLVRRYMDGTLHIFYRDREVGFARFDPHPPAVRVASDSLRAITHTEAVEMPLLRKTV
ncbi:MAG: ISNCY family transposase, partial [Gammaproteobacteria bacterium]